MDVYVSSVVYVQFDFELHVNTNPLFFYYVGKSVRQSLLKPFGNTNIVFEVALNVFKIFLLHYKIKRLSFWRYYYHYYGDGGSHRNI